MASALLGNIISRAYTFVSILLQEEEEPLPPHPLQHQISNGGGGERLGSPTSTLAPPNDLSPPSSTSNNKAASPLMPKKLLGSESKSGGFKGFSRRLSKRGTSFFFGSSYEVSTILIIGNETFIVLAKHKFDTMIVQSFKYFLSCCISYGRKRRGKRQNENQRQAEKIFIQTAFVQRTRK